VLSRWPIRNKLLVGIGLLLVILATMSTSSIQGTYAYRELVRSISSRATELPLATAILDRVSDLRVTLANLEFSSLHPELSMSTSQEQQLSDTFRRQYSDTFHRQFVDVCSRVQVYSDELKIHESYAINIGSAKRELETLTDVAKVLTAIQQLTAADDWFIDSDNTSTVNIELVMLKNSAIKLPSYLESNMQALAGEVKARYRAWIILAWICAVAATVLVAVFIRFGYRWIFRPLRMLVKGSRIVAAGDFTYRIHLDSHDEMAELGAAMNGMTTRFCTIRDDLDRQVQLRTQQVVRSEQLASVGFLAAGVAHEINNPLASIALCAESLEGRLLEMCPGGSVHSELVQRYLKMIQTEAFRCKEITEKLLDFSRLGPAKRQSADLGELVQGVIDMVRHLGKYQNRNIEFIAGQPVIAPVNAQEIKQVVLNLVTNALDSVDAGGTLTIQLTRKPDFAEIIFTDNGCGMTGEVLKHLFEPFFTRKRSGKGTGLGLSIVYRIVSEHGGQIEATSAGPGRGSQFHVTLPLVESKRLPTDNQPQTHIIAKQPLAA
jgi:two-component system, NtrC family, sensor kinase